MPTLLPCSGQQKLPEKKQWQPKDFNWTQAVLEAITPKTAIVALPHCHWTDGSCLDLAIIGQHCREMGEASNFFLSPIVDASLGQILDWGVTDIAAALEVKTDEIAQKAENLGLTVPPKKMRSPHLIGVTLPRGIPQGLGDQLATNSIYVSIRGDAIRIAPHLYTTQADIGRLFDLLAAC